VKLRFFAGLTAAETAEALGIAKSTADDDWAYARSWLRVEIEGAPVGDGA
jgi:DNA-directed RNA polymerase specialized sigma24 family protein